MRREGVIENSFGGAFSTSTESYPSEALGRLAATAGLSGRRSGNEEVGGQFGVRCVRDREAVRSLNHGRSVGQKSIR